MWIYEKKLEYPIRIKTPNPKMAKVIITQYGGPDGELAASLRYLSQRFSMVTPQAKATLNDIGTEELAHLEMVGSMVKQLIENASIEEIERAGLSPYYADHDKAVYPVSAAGVPFTAAYVQSKGDPITDLYEDMAAEHALFLHVVAAGQGFAHGVYEVQRGVGERAGGHGVTCWCRAGGAARFSGSCPAHRLPACAAR